MTDEKLVEEYKKGNKEVFNQIYERYKNAILSYSHSVYCIGADIEDVIQEGMLGLYKAVEYYNGKSSFKNFAFTCIKTNIIKAVKKYFTNKSQPLNTSVSLEECERELQRAQENIEDKIIFKERLDMLLNDLRKNLSPFEMDVLNLFLEGYSYSEIAKKLNKPAKTCDNALQRIRKKIAR